MYEVEVGAVHDNCQLVLRVLGAGAGAFNS